MISEKLHIKLSKFLSLVLRHKPESIGITLDENGWTDVAELIGKMTAYGKQIDFETLDYIVATNNKKRFCFNEDKSEIRASQGHSINIQLGYEVKNPPAVLYHGTAQKSLDSIYQTGLEKRNRHHVHLSKDVETAKAVGSRHGKPVIFEVAAEQMVKDGFEFFESENGVWLTEAVPVGYLKRVGI